VAVPDTLLPTKLADVPSSTVEQYDAVVAGMAAEFVPGVDTTRGAVYDLVLAPAAVLAAAVRQAVDAVWDGLTPTVTADTAVVDKVAAIYRVTRRAAATASGDVTVVVSTLTPTVIPAGSVVTMGGQSFTVDETTAGRTAEDLVTTESDRLMVAVSGGYAFSVPVTATTAGASGNVRFGVAATFSTTVAGFVRAYAAADMTGGADAETNASVLARLNVGLAAHGWSSRLGVVGALTAAGIDGLIGASVIGLGDAEMTRDRRTPWPVSMGGRMDVYTRNVPAWETAVVAGTAVLFSKVGPSGTWRLTLGREAAGGLVDVIGVRQTPDSTNLTPTEEVRGYDTAALAADAVDVQSATEAAYSAYQTLAVKFVDPTVDATNLVVGTSTATYYVVFRRVPSVVAAQTFMLDPSQRPIAGDVCVRGGIPVIVAVTVTLSPPATAVVDTGAVAAAVAGAVNDLGFTLTVPASVVINAALSAAPAGTTVTAVDLYGAARRADGVTVTARSATNLTLTESPAAGFSAKTAVVWCDAADVAVVV